MKQNRKLSKQERIERDLRKSKYNLMCAWTGFVVLMVWMVPMWARGIRIGGSLFSSIFIFVLSFVIVFVCGNNIIKSAWVSARHWTPNMHLLTALGTISALFTGVISILHELELVSSRIENFTAIAGMIMVFHLTGSYIEQTLKRKSMNAIKALVSLSPKEATILQNGKEEVIPITELQVDDIVVVKTGEKIPSDGVIVQGVGEIDESLVTGESIPVEKNVDDRVIGGSINIDGYLRVRIDKVGKKTFLQQVIRLVEMAQGSKPKIQLIADKVIAVFVPTILIISGITFFSWIFFAGQLTVYLSSVLNPMGIIIANGISNNFTLALYTSIAVLVVACPCALGLATPSAIALGVGRSAQLGTLIKDASVFENLKHADTIVMDKTGTITLGKPSVVDVHVSSTFTEEEMLRCAAIVETGSKHPLAQSLIDYYTKKYNVDAVPNAKSFKTLQGKGLQGEVDKAMVVVANPSYVKENNISLSDAAEDTLKKFSEKGCTISVVMKNGTVMGVVGFKDEPRDDSVHAVHMLHKMKLNSVMLTGDIEKAALQIAHQVGIQEVISQATPETKFNVVKDFQSKGHHVVMIGDGINDAPALSQANIGVAMGTGTDIAGEAGDMILIKSTLPVLVSTLLLSKKTYAIITQNIFWACVYNVLLIPLSMAGVIHPVYAEIAMGLSSITVLLNSIRLSRYTPKIS